MKVSEEFSKNSTYYESHNSIQTKVVKKLFSLLDEKPKKILDLGCGSGAICKTIAWEYDSFTGIDFAPGMLELHPKSSKIKCINGDFNDEKLFDTLQKKEFDYIFSSSSLQWAQDIKDVMCKIKSLNSPLLLSVFTSGTFETLNKTASIDSILMSKESLYEVQKECFDVNFEVVKYKLEFESIREMFKYIKRSGVSGSRNILSYKEMKSLMREYPLNYLEFEVAFIYS